MKRITLTIFKCACVALTALLLVNTISLVVELGQHGWNEAFKFQDGTFFLDQRPVGFLWGQGAANCFLVLIFTLSIFLNYMRNDFKEFST